MILQVINHNGGVFGLAVTVFKVGISVIVNISVLLLTS